MEAMENMDGRFENFCFWY